MGISCRNTMNPSLGLEHFHRHFVRLAAVLFFCYVAIHGTESDECTRGYNEAKACLTQGSFGNLSSIIQANLFVSLSEQQHKVFCREWKEDGKPCIEGTFSKCDHLKHAFHGLIHSYDYLCEEEVKKKYKRLHMCTTQRSFIEKSQYCTRGFAGSVGDLNPLLATDDRYKILMKDNPHLQDKWMETCTRMNEYIVCQKSVIKYCGQAQVYYREFELVEKLKWTDLTSDEERELEALRKKKEKIAEDAYEFQEHFMHNALDQHYALVNCGRLSKLALVLIICAGVFVAVVLLCLIPFCCRNCPNRTSWHHTDSIRSNGADNTGFSHDEGTPHKKMDLPL